MKQIKVLLIDDEVEFVTALKERLAIRGLSAEEALNGHQGIEKMAENNYDVILLDMKMPGMKCHDIIDCIKKINPESKIILITGYGSIQENEAELLQKVFSCFNKPIKINKLVDTIYRAVEARNGVQ